MSADTDVVPVMTHDDALAIAARIADLAHKEVVASAAHHAAEEVIESERRALERDRQLLVAYLKQLEDTRGRRKTRLKLTAADDAAYSKVESLSLRKAPDRLECDNVASFMVWAKASDEDRFLRVELRATMTPSKAAEIQAFFPEVSWFAQTEIAKAAVNAYHEEKGQVPLGFKLKVGEDDVRVGAAETQKKLLKQLKAEWKGGLIGAGEEEETE